MYLPRHLLPKANQLVTSGPAVAGALAYGVAAAFGENWRLPFLVMGVVLLMSVIVYFFAVTCVSGSSAEKQNGNNAGLGAADDSDEEENDFIHLDNKKRVIVFYIASVIFGAILTSLYFAVNNNLDIFLKEIGGLSNDTSKLLTVFAPLVAALGPIVVVRLCEKYKNFIAVCGVCFAVAMAFLLVILLVFDINVILSLILMIIFLTVVNGGRSISLSIAALRMRKKVDSGIYSTLVNVASSLGLGLSPKLIAMILDNPALSVEDSWRSSLLAVFAVGVLAVVVLFAFCLIIKRLNKKDSLVKNA